MIMEKDKTPIKYKIKIFIVIVMVAFIIISIVGILWYQEYRLGWERIEEAPTLEDIFHIEASSLGDGFVFASFERAFWHYEGRYIPNYYMAFFSAEGWRKEFTSSKVIRRFDVVETHIYDLRTRERIETIDVLELLEMFPQEMEGYQLRGHVWIGVDNEGVVSMNWPLENIPTSPYTPEMVKVLSMDLDTREVTLHREEDIDSSRNYRTQEQIELRKQIEIFWGWDADESESHRFLNNNGIRRYVGDREFRVWEGRHSGQVDIRMTGAHLPSESVELYRRFPGLERLIGNRGIEVVITLNGYPTAEEIMSLLMEDGQEISFEGSVLSETRSIDGQEHEINSFEDFFRWIDVDR